MHLTTPSGAPVASDKPVHEPRMFKRDKERIEAEFTRLIQEYIAECTPLEGGNDVAKPDVAAIRFSKGSEFQETVRRITAQNATIGADPDAVFKRIDEMQADLVKRTRLATPMDELKDGLRAFDFVPLAECVYGQLWLAVNDAHWVAIALSGTGISTLFFGLGEVPALVALIDAAELSPQCRQPKWTMNEVTLLMRAMRWQKVKAPEPVMLQAALAELPKTRKKLFPWT